MFSRSRPGGGAPSGGGQQMLEARTNPGLPAATTRPGGRVRDDRLDVFRGLAMFIILAAHIEGNRWSLWIPGRFGFSDSTELFVFCSGFASSLAFGTIFIRRGLLMGTARIAHRIWQIYWAHIVTLLVGVALVWALHQTGLGSRDVQNLQRPDLRYFFEHPGESVFGAMTLRYVPPLFDILPMYLVMLAMIPVTMTLHRIGGFAAVAATSILVWLLANVAGREVAGSLGTAFAWMNLPARPDGSFHWFFNPFAWQLIFFTGFAFGRGWLPAPPRSRTLVIVAAAVVVLSLPLAWHKLYAAWGYLPPHGGLQTGLHTVRDGLEPLFNKTRLGLLRDVHFLALAYLVWIAVGPRGERLRTGFARLPAPGRLACGLAVLVTFVTAPYVYHADILLVSPALASVLAAHVPPIPGRDIGLTEIAHILAMLVLAWGLLGVEQRTRAGTAGFLAVVGIVRKVGTQCLAVFVASLPLAILLAFVLDLTGRTMLTTTIVNLVGFATLVAVAHVVAWYKSEPWRDSAPRRSSMPDEVGPTRAAA